MTMTNIQLAAGDMRAVAPPDDPQIDYQAALYFLDGHYLFRSRSGRGWSSKFVTAWDVKAAFVGKETDSGWLLPGVVRSGSNRSGKWFVYSAPSQKTVISFDGEDGTIKIPLPRTVLIGNGSNYYLWSLVADRFDRNAIAYAAPYPNIHGEGKICWGAATPPRADPERAREVWDLFFSTPFNNHLVDRKSKSHPDDVRLALRESAGKREYPINDMQTTGASIGSLVNHLLGV